MHKRLLVLAVAGAIGAAGLATAAVPSGGRFATLTQPTHLNRGDVVQNALPLTRQVSVTVVLKLRNEAQLRTFNSQPHAAMSHAQLAADYLPTPAAAQAVADYLKQAGFSNVRISSNRMLVNATGSAATVQSAFRTSLVTVHTHDGRNAFANSSTIQIPVALQGSVQAVLGLQTVHKAHVLARAVPNDTVGVEGHNPLDFASIYDASGLKPASNINVGIIGWGSMAPTLADLNTFTATNGLKKVNAKVVCIDYGGYDSGVINTTDPTCKNFDQGTTEWDIDSQDIIAMSGGVKSLTFYAAYGGYNNSITNAISQTVTPTAGEPLAQVVNMSFGECERNQDSGQGGDGSAQADDALFQLGAAHGQTFSAATGDYGSDECGDGQMDSASYPASSPWVVAVSGTTLRASSTTWARENVWLDAGGSPSSFEKAQSWQSGLTYGQYAGARGPDVAFEANPSSGAIVVVNGALEQWGGTSLASPIFVGAWARILQGNPKLGFAAPHLYALPTSALHDIRAGNNGQYIAKPGWDWATGLGSFDVGEAVAALK
ncbi:MAG TPA: S53 family peptidase [Rhodanobacteraceae bacterium]|nr:S53 family peptidase [Rhodanobacteraceae bacterium]